MAEEIEAGGGDGIESRGDDDGVAAGRPLADHPGEGIGERRLDALDACEGGAASQLGEEGVEAGERIGGGVGGGGRSGRGGGEGGAAGLDVGAGLGEATGGGVGALGKGEDTGGGVDAVGIEQGLENEPVEAEGAGVVGDALYEGGLVARAGVGAGAGEARHGVEPVGLKGGEDGAGVGAQGLGVGERGGPVPRGDIGLDDRDEGVAEGQSAVAQFAQEVVEFLAQADLGQQRREGGVKGGLGSVAENRLVDEVAHAPGATGQVVLRDGIEERFVFGGLEGAKSFEGGVHGGEVAGLAMRAREQAERREGARVRGEPVLGDGHGGAGVAGVQQAQQDDLAAKGIGLGVARGDEGRGLGRALVGDEGVDGLFVDPEGIAGRTRVGGQRVVKFAGELAKLDRPGGLVAVAGEVDGDLEVGAARVAVLEAVEQEFAGLGAQPHEDVDAGEFEPGGGVGRVFFHPETEQAEALVEAALGEFVAREQDEALALQARALAPAGGEHEVEVAHAVVRVGALVARVDDGGGGEIGGDGARRAPEQQAAHADGEGVVEVALPVGRHATGRERAGRVRGLPEVEQPQAPATVGQGLRRPDEEDFFQRHGWLDGERGRGARKGGGDERVTGR